MVYGSGLNREPKLARPPNSCNSALYTVTEDVEQRMNDHSDSGQVRLEDLGYKQEIWRALQLMRLHQPHVVHDGHRW